MTTFRAFSLSICCLLAAFLFSTTELHAQASVEQRSLRDIITEIQEQTGFRFLYREALIADIRLSLPAEDDHPFSALREQLKPYNLTVRIDSSYNQAIILKLPGNRSSQKNLQISGHVVDASSGERLPYATIKWQQKGNVNGISANSSGAFQASISTTKSELEITCSYVGYRSETLSLGTNGQPLDELTFRLEPQRIDGNELIVTGSNFYGQVDDNLANLVDIGTFSPLGSSNSVRALQSLPSAALTPALSGDMHVRGSPADGFQVLIDGITVFNQSHLFGLLDSFNADVLQRSGFYYDISPAQYQAPPGGTLSLATQTGSLNKFSSTSGLSNTAYRATLEGPITEGKSSWLVSARSSYLNQVNWLNNSELIQWGLDVDRPREVLEEDLLNLETRLVTPGETDAHFFDLHSKLYFEGKDGSRFIISGYLGGDNTKQQAERLVRSFRLNGPNFRIQQVQTENEWSNGALSLQYQDQLSKQVYIHTTAGASVYQSDFFKEDFSYTRIDQSSGSFQVFTFPFENQSILNEFKLEQQVDITTGPWMWTTGFSYHYYLGEYYEDSFSRSGFFTNIDAHRFDLYVQLDYTSLDWADLSAGSRMHYYSNGEYLRWSPRVKLRFLPGSPVSFGGGFSRNYQFFNKISLSNTVTSDVWVPVDSDQPPTGVNYFSGGIYLEPAPWLYAQVEAYHKDFSHVRLHEINAFSLSNTFSDAPWYSDNDGEAVGLELMLKSRFGLFQLSQMLSISRMQLSNPILNDGEPFYVDWDRRYRYGATLEAEPLPHLFTYFSWSYATGTPNRLAIFGASNDERLDHYQRTDVTVEYKNQFPFGSVNASFSVFNLWDRKNSWYRELAFVIDQSQSDRNFRSVPVDVYDIGIQPSFNLSVSF